LYENTGYNVRNIFEFVCEKEGVWGFIRNLGGLLSLIELFLGFLLVRLRRVWGGFLVLVRVGF
jgi:hypothetical protein